MQLASNATSENVVEPVDPNTGFGQVHLTPTKVIVSSLWTIMISTQGDFLVLETKRHTNDAVVFYEK